MQKAMGIDWTDDPEALREAIPPAYSAWIGERLLEHLSAPALERAA
jgi:DNA (cytosine-5)-methyltransferase 1